MSQPELRRYLPAFADGELAVERNLQVLEQLAMDPQHTHRVVHQQQLKDAVGRAMAEPGQAPRDLRQQIEALAAEEANASADDQTQRSSSSGKRSEASPVIGSLAAWWQRPGVRRWGAVAAAAAMVLAAITLWPMRSPTGPAQAGLLSQAQLARFSQRHVQCSQGLAQLQNVAAYPTELAQLPAALQQRLDHPGITGAALDLSAAGYVFDRAGDCHIPGPNSAHLIYRAKPGTGRSDALSLWLRPATGQLGLEPGRLYQAAGPQQAHPMLMWRDRGLIYYLVGDGPRQTRQVAELIRTHSGT